MKIAIAVAHSSWEPHRGGGSTKQWSENGLSKTVSAVLANNLRAIGCEPKLFEIPEQSGADIFRCAAKHSRYTSCKRYNDGLNWIVRQCKQYAAPYGIALSFHFGRGKPGWSGPLALINASGLARRWAQEYLASFWELSDIPGRGAWELPKHKREFPRNPVFLRAGPASGSVLIELGNAASANDCALFDNGSGISFAVESAIEATRAILT